MKKTFTCLLFFTFFSFFLANAQQFSLLKDINAGSASGSPKNLTNVKDVLYFSANDGKHGIELWKSDGSAKGTAMVKDINAGNNTSNSYPESFTNINGLLYFAANDGVHGLELWKSNGTEKGTVLVKDINPGPNNGFVQNLININGTLFFAADDGIHGLELWKSDGSSAGTVMVKDIYAGRYGSLPFQFTNINGKLFFSANDGIHGFEIWKSDGTEAGTVMIKDVNPGFNSGAAENLTNVNGTLYFTGNDGSHGTELWKSDGTEAGTIIVKDINQVSGSSLPDKFTNVNGTLFFTANDGIHGIELWKSDGTDAGTVLVKDITLLRNTSTNVGRDTYFSSFINFNGTLFFDADDGIHGDELWKTNGTDAGTVLVKDIYPGSIGGFPEDFAVINGVLYFNANDGIHGAELWKTDGTDAGTTMIQEFNAGSEGASPQSLTDVNGRTFLIASTKQYGQELYVSAINIIIDDAAVYESQGVVNVVVRLSAPSADQIKVHYQTVDGTAKSPADYQSKTGEVIFAPGATTAAISIPIVKDNKAEGDENFTVQLSNPVNANLFDDAGNVTVKDDVAPATTFKATTEKTNEIYAGKLTAKVWPNPSSNYFTIIINANNNVLVSIKVMDALGRLVEEKRNVAANGTLRFGENYRPGIYYAEVVQGNERLVLTLEKVSD